MVEELGGVEWGKPQSGHSIWGKKGYFQLKRKKGKKERKSISFSRVAARITKWSNSRVIGVNTLSLLNILLLFAF